MLKRKSPKPSLRRAATVEELTRQNVETIREMEHSVEGSRGVGERFADAFAKIVGSWTFVIIQTSFVIAWVSLNVSHDVHHWDGYPFVLMSLTLAFQAAYATPIIMMAQNRQAKVSERRNHLDLQINLLAEQENTEMLRLLRMICQKLEIKIPNEAAIRALEQQTEHANLMEQIDEHIGTPPGESTAK